MSPVNKKKYHAKKGSSKAPQERSSSSSRPQQQPKGGGRGAGPRKKQQYSSNHKKFPLITKRRGGPGMLLTCEAGREAQCCREGLQILQHYYEQQQQQQVNNDKNNNDNDNVDISNDHTNAMNTNKAKILTMDEEIALLQQQHSTTTTAASSVPASSNVPFAMYETGCRGIVFIMCTLPGCALIPLSLLQQPHRHSNPTTTKRDNVNEESKEENDDDDVNEPPAEEEDNDNPVESKTTERHAEPTRDASTKKRPADDELDETDSHNLTQNSTKKQRAVETGNGIADSEPTLDSSSNKPASKTDNAPSSDLATTTTTTTTSPSSSTAIRPIPWDPVATIHSIIHDLSPTTPAKSRSLEPPPSSRFVTRMIPMQGTCYASMEEIRILGRALIQRYLREYQSNDKNTSNNDGSQQLPPLKTFSIAVKRRICSNVTRDEIIEELATAVMDSSVPITDNHKSDNNTQSQQQQQQQSSISWKVDLKNPDMIVQVEICKTLCGIAVFSGIEHRTLYHNFNLIEIRTEEPTPAPIAPSTSTGAGAATEQKNGEAE